MRSYSLEHKLVSAIIAAIHAATDGKNNDIRLKLTSIVSVTHEDQIDWHEKPLPDCTDLHLDQRVCVQRSDR